MRLTRIPTTTQPTTHKKQAIERYIRASRISHFRLSRPGSSPKKRGFLDWIISFFSYLSLSTALPPGPTGTFPSAVSHVFLAFLSSFHQGLFYFDRRGIPVRRCWAPCHFLATNYGAQSSKQRLCPLFFFVLCPPSIAIDPMTEAVDAKHRILNLSLLFRANMIHSSFPFPFLSYTETGRDLSVPLRWYDHSTTKYYLVAV